MNTKKFYQFILIGLFFAINHPHSSANAMDYFTGFLCGDISDAVETALNKTPKLEDKFITIKVNNYTQNKTPSGNMEALKNAILNNESNFRVIIDVQELNFEGINFSQYFKNEPPQAGFNFSSFLQYDPLNFFQNDPLKNKIKQSVFNFQKCKMKDASFENCSIPGVCFDDADLRNVCFNFSNLSDANDEDKPYYTNLSNTDKNIPVYRNTSFERANILGATFEQAKIPGYRLRNVAKNWEKVNLKNLAVPDIVVRHNKSGGIF